MHINLSFPVWFLTIRSFLVFISHPLFPSSFFHLSTCSFTHLSSHRLSCSHLPPPPLHQNIFQIFFFLHSFSFRSPTPSFFFLPSLSASLAPSPQYHCRLHGDRLVVDTVLGRGSRWRGREGVNKVDLSLCISQEAINQFCQCPLPKHQLN